VIEIEEVIVESSSSSSGDYLIDSFNRDNEAYTVLSCRVVYSMYLVVPSENRREIDKRSIV
jgi:hypothetical protein